jgi:hypothetical protein
MWYRVVVAAKNGVYVSDLDLPIDETLYKILEDLRNQGFKALVVGGAVRDAVMGVVPKDIDVEVYGADYDTLNETLSKYGRADIVGKSFGVVKLRTPDGQDYDFSVPRRDSKTGDGHTGFEVTVDHSMTPEQAAARRDFSMNALAFDPITKEVHDYYGGVEDLQNGVLRATTEAFKEDPLRVLRGMQFAARYGLRLDPKTADMCREIVDSHDELAKERISEEWMKLAVKGKYPGTALEYLADTGWLKNYPELESLFNTPQDPEWHPEGWQHYDAPEEKRKIYTKEDNNVSHWQDVAGFSGGAQTGSRRVAINHPDYYTEPHLYITMDLPLTVYWKYVHEQDRESTDPIANLAIRHLVMQYGGSELNKLKHYRDGSGIPLAAAVYTHAEKQGDNIELTVGLNSELSEELVKRGCPQHTYVKMGDVAEHTAHVMNAAAEVAERDGVTGDDRATLVLAALVHDIAKPQTTEIQHKKGRGISITSAGHEKAGEPVALELLERMGIKKSIREKVGPLVARHLAHISTIPTKSGVRKLAHSIAPATMEELGRLIESDHSGRPPLPKELPRQAEQLLDLARSENVADGKPAPIIQGKHVLPYYGGSSGKHIGTAVSDAYSAYLNGAYDNFETGQKWLQSYLQPKASMLRGSDAIELGMPAGPEIGQILSEAWKLQVSGVFANREDALAWLKSRVQNS